MKGHIEAVFPDAKVTEATRTDYRYRAVLPRSVVAQALADHAMTMTYDNYKNTVRENRFHDALAAAYINTRSQGCGWHDEERTMREEIASCAADKNS